MLFGVRERFLSDFAVAIWLRFISTARAGGAAAIVVEFLLSVRQANSLLFHFLLYFIANAQCIVQIYNEYLVFSWFTFN